MSWGFFVPLFFVLVGFGTDFRDLFTTSVAIGAFVALTVYAIASKFLVGSAVGLSLKRSSEESFSIGFLVVSRGAVELAMAVTLLSAGVFTTSVFTIVAGIGLITTIVAPIGARPMIRRMQASAHRARRERSPATEWTGQLPLPSPVDPGERPPLPK